MDIEVRLDCSNVDWETVSDTLKDVEIQEVYIRPWPLPFQIAHVNRLRDSIRTA